MTEAQLATSLQDARALIDALILASRSERNTVAPISSRARFRFGTVVLDLHYRRVTRDGREVSLTPREYDMLVELARGEGAPVSVEHLAQTVWKGHISPESRTIAQHVAEVRGKLEEIPSEPRYLLTVRKFGYRLYGEWVMD